MPIVEAGMTFLAGAIITKVAGIMKLNSMNKARKNKKRISHIDGYAVNMDEFTNHRGEVLVGIVVVELESGLRCVFTQQELEVFSRAETLKKLAEAGLLPDDPNLILTPFFAEVEKLREEKEWSPGRQAQKV